MVVGPARDEIEAVLEETVGKGLRIFDHLLGVLEEVRSERLAEGNGDGGRRVVVWPTL